MKPEWVLKGVIAGVMATWVSVPVALKILLVINCVEVLTGLFNPKVHLVLQLRRITIALILTLTTQYIYGLAKLQTGLNLGIEASSVVGFFYSISSVIFVCKNVHACGVDLPPFLLDALSKAEGITGVDRRDVIELRKTQDEGRVKPV